MNNIIYSFPNMRQQLEANLLILKSYLIQCCNLNKATHVFSRLYGNGQHQESIYHLFFWCKFAVFYKSNINDFALKTWYRIVQVLCRISSHIGRFLRLVHISVGTILCASFYFLASDDAPLLKDCDISCKGGI